jgi:enolase-phosphatase E1
MNAGSNTISAILLDIEGTTTPVDFVHTTLFSFARRHMAQFLQRHWAEDATQADIAGLMELHGGELARGTRIPPWTADSPESGQAAALAYINWLMDHDVKCTPLKSLQGRIWLDGYKCGELRAEIFTDVPDAFSRWSRQNRSVLIFSSGSVLAQKALFENTTCGDLSHFLMGYFDTTTGSKIQAQSYRKISSLLSRPPAEIIFISDTLSELDAAGEAGMQTVQCVRNSSPVRTASPHPAVSTLNDIFPEQS